MEAHYLMEKVIQCCTLNKIEFSNSGIGAQRQVQEPGLLIYWDRYHDVCKE